MNEELMTNNELEGTEEYNIYDGPEESKGSLAKTLIKAGLVAAGGAAAAVVIKNRKKIEEWKIKRLEKKGYVITKPAELCASCDEDDCNEAAE